MAGRVARSHIGHQGSGHAAGAPVDREVGIGRLEGDPVHLVDEAKSGVADADVPEVAEARAPRIAGRQGFEHRPDDGGGLATVRRRRRVGRGQTERDALARLPHDCRLDPVEIHKSRRKPSDQQLRDAQTERELGNRSDEVAVGARQLHCGKPEPELLFVRRPAQFRVAHGEPPALQIGTNGVLDHLIEDGEGDRSVRQPPGQNGEQHSGRRNGDANGFQCNLTRPPDQETTGLLSLVTTEQRQDEFASLLPASFAQVSQFGVTSLSRNRFTVYDVR